LSSYNSQAFACFRTFSFDTGIVKKVTGEIEEITVEKLTSFLNN